MPDKPTPKVFISYSHDSPEHAKRVLALANALRRDGIDAILDQYNPVPREGWPRWMERNLAAADFVLMVCTEAYYRRVMGTEAPGVGLGVQWESNLIYNSIYQNASQGHKYLPILLDGAEANSIPAPVQGHTHFPLAEFQLADTHYDVLYRHLTGQSLTPPLRGDLKKLPALPGLEAKSVQPWNIPYVRNPFFTAREDTLTLLVSMLQTENSAAITQPAAISGMGGIGKTQTAIEYAYRHRGEYDAVLWIKSENETTLRESFIDVARLLELPEADEQDQNLAIAATKRWLTFNSGWLLIMDNADDLSVARKFLPMTSNGHILYTTQASSGGQHAKAIRLDKLSVEDGALLLLRRAAILDQNALLEAARLEDRDAALKLSEMVDGLPLALDQAGAFIQEQQTSVARYLKLYEKQEAKLLADYGDPKDREHASVAVTFSLAFAQAEATNPAVGDLLRLCVFLAPDDIPELIFTQEQEKDDNLGEHLSPIVGDELAWEKLLGEASRYSLVTRDAAKGMLNIHRLVQVVLREAMTEADQRNWLECAIHAIFMAFPGGDFRTWAICDQLLSHQQVCSGWIKTYNLVSYDAGSLLIQTGYYLNERAQYDQAELLYLEALEIYRRQLGSDHPDTATSLNNLAILYYSQGRYVDAEPLYLEALLIRKRQLGSDHPDTAGSLNNLAVLYKTQGRYVDAELLFLEALELHRRQLGSDHSSTALSLNNLAEVYRSQGRYMEAEPLYLEALEIYRRQLGSDHPDTASSLNYLANLYRSQGRYIEAEPLYLESLDVRKRQLDSDHPDTAISLFNLAGFYYEQSQYSKAKSYIEEAHPIFLKALGAEHPHTIISQGWYDLIIAALKAQAE